MQKKKPGRNIFFIVLIALLFILLYRSGYLTRKDSSEALDRNPSQIIYSKHARCRMDCRMITEDEVKQILKEGRVNYGKSNTDHKPDAQYALEGKTSDGQHVRIVFAISQGKAVVVTVIDLKKEWTCNCP
jgi:hypothetical protein